MSKFRIRPDKTRHTVDTQTLDETHRGIIAKFQRQQKLLPKKKEKIETLKTELYELDQRNGASYTNQDIHRKAEIKDQIRTIEEEVYDIENHISETEYFSKVSDILSDYYEILEGDKEVLYDHDPDMNEEKLSIAEEKLDTLDILALRNKSNKKVKKPNTRKKKKNLSNSSASILTFFGGDDAPTETVSDSCLLSETANQNRAALFDQFRILTDNEYMYEKKRNKFQIRTCSVCGEERTLIQSEGILACQKCGEVEMIIIESEKPNYKDSSTPEKPGYPYKRLNHFQEWLSQFQAKESTEIPKDVYEQIIAELHKNRIYNFKNIHPFYMKETILKNLNLTSYYEHTIHIISKLSGKEPPSINRETEEKLKKMFMMIQPPFEKFCPSSRQNFLSYSYVLHKFCELLELDDFIQFFPLLKSREKLKIQDRIWEKICQELKWEFIPSI